VGARQLRFLAVFTSQYFSVHFEGPHELNQLTNQRTLPNVDQHLLIALILALTYNGHIPVSIRLTVNPKRERKKKNVLRTLMKAYHIKYSQKLDTQQNLTKHT
jgi:hypothetical protein